MDRTVSRRLGITGKLLLWCLLLVTIFYATTSMLFLRIQSLVEVSNAIVNVNYDIDKSAQHMIQTLLSMEENRKRFEILQKDIYMENFLADMQEFGKTLNGVLARHPEYRTPWKELTQEYTIVLSRSRDPETSSLPDKTITRWLEILSATRQSNQDEMESRLNELAVRSKTAERLGFIGLVASIAIGVLGSVFIAYRLNLSLSEIRRGIRELGRGEPARPVHVTSQDELGDLAQAFNNMTARLQEEERMRQDFIAMLSHEIRTPLTSIRESVDLVADGVFGEVNEKQHHFLDISRQEAQRLTSLLERLMKVSSLESQRLKLVTAPLDASALARGAVERLQSTALAKNIALKTELPEQFVFVEADQEHVTQVLANLLGNAVKFSPPDSVVRLSVTPEPTGDSVIFCVVDEGPGIAIEEQARIFLKYYREPSVRGSVAGLGLGLSIAKGIVEAHGGAMWLNSAPGCGSSFCFSLPKPKAMV
ncbi:MAG: HAMP domain-containing sensor histidine kinase [Humidesulfovibrio sp.]|uniref:HAMP domain-containing sensor histidine kinase n=1 Tax=Humidesulfovibrio sp. TaxID=2910988 RepID=UPI0027F5B966|nr:HAMP domain-containing sensor histidine kinase [Humidesulfovibrio sp.]MDQ7835050.1 HAMP domain-containing sensor histidine kinase [Humidesulfovibrio sp.]